MDHAPILDLATLSHLTPGALRALWPQWFDRPPPARFRRELLVRALAYRMQERGVGGLSVATRTKLLALAEVGKDHSKKEGIEPPRLTPGTHISREWGNETHQVTVDAAGLVYRGRRYRSLSEIARRITGTRWSGPLFFGVRASSNGQRVHGKEG